MTPDPAVILGLDIRTIAGATIGMAVVCLMAVGIVSWISWHREEKSKREELLVRLRDL